MTLPFSACPLPAALAGLGLLFAPGCAAPTAPHAPAHALELRDAQSCLEDALRRRPDTALARDAVEQLSVSCRFGDLGSCSALGVAYELGLGVRADRAYARALYEQACSGRNVRACANLGEAMLRDASLEAPLGALALLRNACELGQGRACTTLGQAYLGGRVGTPLGGAPFLERACARGQGAGCLGLADLAERGIVPGGTARVAELAAAACARGDEEGCARHARSAAAPGPGQPAIAGGPEVGARGGSSAAAGRR